MTAGAFQNSCVSNCFSQLQLDCYHLVVRTLFVHKIHLPVSELLEICNCICSHEVRVMQVLARGLGESLYTTVEGRIHSLMALLSAFSSLFYHSILTLHDDDFRPVSALRTQQQDGL